jgi:hypothetical protein
MPNTELRVNDPASTIWSPYSMKLKAKVLSFFLVILMVMPLLIASESGAAIAIKMEPMKITPEMIENEFNAIRKAPNPDDLERISRDLRDIAQGDINPHAMLQLYLKAIDALDQIIDPSFTGWGGADNLSEGVGCYISQSKEECDKILKNFDKDIAKRREELHKQNMYGMVQTIGRDLLRNWMDGLTCLCMRTKCTFDEHEAEEIQQLIETNLSSKTRREEVMAALKIK